MLKEVFDAGSEASQGSLQTVVVGVSHGSGKSNESTSDSFWNSRSSPSNRIVRKGREKKIRTKVILIILIAFACYLHGNI